jgi:hypothetical protein
VSPHEEKQLLIRTIRHIEEAVGLLQILNRKENKKSINSIINLLLVGGKKQINKLIKE